MVWRTKGESVDRHTHGRRETRLAFARNIMQVAALRSQVESALGVEFSPPLSFRNPPPVERVSSGFTELDTLTGGLPRGGITEVCGRTSSGRASLALSVLAQRTAQGEICAWVDAGDCFDTHSARRNGVALHRLLWVRCRDLEQAIQAAGLVLEGGGFGLVVLDLGGVPLRALHRLPLSFWFRFRLSIERTPTLLLVLTPEACARSCAQLCLRLRLREASWSTVPDARPVSHSCLLRGACFNAEVIRSRFQRPSEAACRINLRTEINYQARLFEAL
jgi:hypothetical protein